MNIVPRHKSDIDSCNQLALADDAQVAEQVYELIEWIQDMNWPVAGPVAARLIALRLELVPPIREVLAGADDAWKYWVVASLLPQVHPTVVEALRPELTQLIENPSSGELQEGVVDATRELLQCK